MSEVDTFYNYVLYCIQNIIMATRGVYSSRKSELFPSTMCRLPNPSPTSKLQVPPNQAQGHKSIFWHFLCDVFCLTSQCQMPARTHKEVSEGGCAPLRSWKILYFWNWNRTIWWILLGANLEQAMIKKLSSMDLTDPNFAFWGEFWFTFC